MWNDEGFGYGMDAMGDGMWHWIMGFHGILSLIFLALIIVGVVLLVRDLRRYGWENSASDTPTSKHRVVDTHGKADSSRGNNIGPDRHA